MVWAIRICSSHLLLFDQKERSAMKKGREDRTQSSFSRYYALGLVAELFQRYFSGRAGKKEIEAVETWEAGEETDRYEISPKQVEEGTMRVWKTVCVKLNLDCKEKKSDIVDLRQYNLKNRFGHFTRKYAATVAVFFTVALAGTIVFLLNPIQVKQLIGLNAWDTIAIHTNLNELKKFELSDGSVIYLNGKSNFQYIDQKFNKREREVWLEGEAFFEVAHDGKRPFIIHTGDLKTIVRGTSFNIKAYDELNENVITVRSGKVEVRKDRQLLEMLTKNKQLTYLPTQNAYRLNTVQWEKAARWRTGDLVLNNADIKELKFRLYQYFGVNVSCSDDLLVTAKFNATFSKGSSLENVLKNISTLYKIKYQINGQQVILFR